MSSSPDITPTRHLSFLRIFRISGRAILLAVVITFVASGQAAGQASAPSAGTFTPLAWAFTADEGQTFSGVVAAFTDSDSVTADNFTNVEINWGDGTALSAGTPLQSGVNPHLFYISGTHTFAEEGASALTITLFDT